MTTLLERRLRALERRQQDRQMRLTADEQRAAVAQLLRGEGLDEQQAVERFGSMGGFCYWLMSRPWPGTARGHAATRAEVGLAREPH